MSATETGLTALERNWAMVDRALEDLDDGIIAARPNEDSNSIGWLLWHMNRGLIALSTPGARTPRKCGPRAVGTRSSALAPIHRRDERRGVVKG